MERRLSAILAADIVGYSRLMGQDEAGTLEALLHFRSELFEPEVASNRGKIIKSMGDGWLVSFLSVAEAVSCALQIQDKLSMHERLKLRIGVHIGDVVFRDEDIFGNGVNVAARLQEFAEAGTVTISDAAYGTLDGSLAPSFDDAGTQEFKNISRPIQVWQRAAPLPPPATSEVGGFSDERPVLVLRPVVTSDDRAELRDLANALTGDILNCFSSVRWLNAITSSDERRHDTAYAMTANLRASGSHLRFEVSMVTPDRKPLWSAKYDGDLSNAFDWQDQTAQTTAIDALAQVLDRERLRVHSLSLSDMTAEECVIASYMEFEALDEPTMTSNLAYLSAAIEKRPDYAEGYGHVIANFVACTSMNYGTILDRYQDAFPRWVEAASNLKDPTPILTIGLGLVAYRFNGDAAALRRAIKDALRRAPLSVEVVCYCGFGYLWMSEPELALDCFRSGEKLMEFNPYATAMLGGASIACVMAGDDAAAIAFAKKGLEMAGSYMALHSSMGAAYGHKGRLEEAAYHVARLEERNPGYSISSHRANSRYADTPGYRRFEEGLRKAGLPE